MSAYNCEKTQNVEKMYLRVVVEKRESFSIMKDGCEVWRFTRDDGGLQPFPLRDLDSYNPPRWDR